ncbi:MAG: hypothetical protein COT81_01630 [Candidatus Buchananbacteria bacterium CG10_big_fil_rev_8_21_14_0_10_42_9]|uniref:PDZ domain-containing protein n=1 Tax=Candidatus Buchananbacteria bacterium CG10_big_fil_rev_8_21_14_0_10_42_9 TaxID=1974526 RepID=A0A2H0W1X1_9BACT|nr:MAG: hypothetical protein COT81_01630 [Candidatus Buchananbacteria bacterium CG10_big_fil_rev_8_21_14_0_10_42_9]
MEYKKSSQDPKVIAFTYGVIGALLVLVIAGFIAWNSQEEIVQWLSDKQGDQIKTLITQSPNGNEYDGSLVTQETFVVEAVKRANPAVVSVIISKDVPIYEQYYENVNPFGDDFFGFQIPQLRQRQNGTEKREIGGGSGFLVSADGLIITNKHVVVAQDAEYAVFTSDGESYEAEILARDPFFDLAVMKIKGDDFPYLEFADSSEIQLGQSVIAIGNALSEYRNSVSVGIVSGLSRNIVAGTGFGQFEQIEEVIQTDAAINPGNSGGPLLNLSGKVIGVNVAVAGGAENIGFSIPSNKVKSIVDSVIETGRIVRPYIGVRYQTITESLAEANGLPYDYGALIVRGETSEELAVIPGSPANKAGLEENDIILEIDGVKLDERSLASVIRDKQVSDTITLKVYQKGEEREVRITLEELSE